MWIKPPPPTSPRPHARTHMHGLCLPGFVPKFLPLWALFFFFHFLFLLSVTTLLLSPLPAFSKTRMWKEATFYRGQWKNWNAFSLRHLCQISYYELLNHAGNTLRGDSRAGLNWSRSKFTVHRSAAVMVLVVFGCLLTSPWVGRTF